MVVAPRNVCNSPVNSSAGSSSSIDSGLVGLDYILENPDYLEKLASVLVTDSVVMKKQVFELLSALCVYNSEGYIRTFECLDLYKSKTGERYRYKFMVKELENSENSNEYRTAILAFINCLILSTHDLHERIRIRSEFIGLHLLNVIHELRSKEDGDLVVQLDVFDEQRESDESQINPNLNGIDLSSPLEVFDAILAQIANTPQEHAFLCILQHLLRIESKDSVSDIIWDTAERLVHRATLLESAEDVNTLFRPTNHENSSTQSKSNESTETDNKCTAATSSSSPVLPPPPPPQPTQTIQPPQHGPLPCPPPPAPPPISILQNVNNNENETKLPQQTIPTPSSKMRTVNWNKISSVQVLNGNQNNLWATFAKTHSNTPIALDWNTLEGLFCLQNDKSQQPLLNSSSSSSSSKPRQQFLQPNDAKMISKRESNEVILLDAKRSLNINIFLKQFRRSNDDMIGLIEDGNSQDFGSEKLRGLLKILPSKDEIEMIRSVSAEDKLRLGSAEKFLLQLIQVRDCKLRIEVMLLKEELDPCVNNVEIAINAILHAAQDVKESKELQQIIFMILVAGNFLNSGGYAGDAAGLKLSSLQKITDIRGNKPGISLLHFIAMQAEAEDPKLLNFVDELPTLQEASKTSTDQLKSEIRNLKSKVENINEQLNQPNIAPEIHTQFSKFVKNASVQISALESSFADIEKARVDLAHFFCEELSNFKLEDCFKILATFAGNWRQAVAENVRRKVAEQEGENRRLVREAQLKKKQLTPQLHQDDNNYGFKRKNIVIPSGNILDEIMALSPKRKIDVNGNTSNSIRNTSDQSPDTTPNGSISRRRYRQHFYDDETGLMEFLRSSSDEQQQQQQQQGSSSRERERERERTPRRRLNLPEFNFDRERPPSPQQVPVSNDHDLVPEPEKEEKDEKSARASRKPDSSERENETDGDSNVRRSVIGSLATTKPPHEKLVLYISAPTKPNAPTRQGSTGEEEGEDSEKKQQIQNINNSSGSEEGFNRLESIRRSRKLKQIPDVSEPPKLATESRLKSIFGSGKLKTDTPRPPLRRSVSLESNHKSSLRFSLRGKTPSAPAATATIIEHDEEIQVKDAREVQSGHAAAAAAIARATRRGGFREGREAVSTRSLVAAARATASRAAVEKLNASAPISKIQEPNKTKSTNTGTGSVIVKSGSRSSLLSSRNSPASQTQPQPTKLLKSTISNKMSRPPIPPLNLTRNAVSASNVLQPTKPLPRPKAVMIRSASKPDSLKSSSAQAEMTKSPQCPRQQSNGILSFMRPTAASSAKDSANAKRAFK